MQNGLIFDIKEFALNDGPGIRLTVFFKGCPLECIWCHNPEGILEEPELNQKTNQITGKFYSSEELIKHITKFRDVFELSNGGVTFSGGEPTKQHSFLIEVLKGLSGIHKTLDTCGYCDEPVFKEIIQYIDLVYFDYKLGNPNKHIEYTGKSNDIILKNLQTLSNSKVDYVIRVPLIPKITDTLDNLKELINILENLPNKPLRIDLLPYNKLAGGKYENYGRTYTLSGITDNNDENVAMIKQRIKERRLCKHI